MGVRVVRAVFERWDTPWLRGHLVWIPMLEEDDLDAAIAQEEAFQDERLSQYWDGDRVFGGLVSQTLQLATPVAWDIYLLYSPGAMWQGKTMPRPDFWMHQLNERRDLLLDPDRLMDEVEKLILAARKGEYSND